MGKQILLQPDGLYSVWDGGIDELIVQDATENELINWFASIAWHQAVNETRQNCAAAKERGSSAGRPFAISWAEARRRTESKKGHTRNGN